MSAYDERYEIRQANIDDIPAIMDYIEDDWRHGHIMATNRRLFDYEFLNDDKSVNVVIAIDRQKNTIEGMIGYLYSSMEKGKQDVWGSIWKVRDGNQSLLGVEIMKRMEEISGCRYNLGTGANPKTNIPLMRVMFRRTAAKMKQYYHLSDRLVSDYKIAKISYIPKELTLENSCENYVVKKVLNPDELCAFFASEEVSELIPYKDLWYVKKKFYEHPIHNYVIYSICRQEGDVKAIFVLRDQEACGHGCIRMVDYIGDFSVIKYTAEFWNNILLETGAEYVDFYCLGMEDEDMAMAGFSLLKDGDDNVIPNYFSPFCQENIDIWVHYPVEGVTFTKADGDQDRPNKEG